MEAIAQIAWTSFAMIGAGWFMYLVGSHGWKYVADRIKARAAAVEAKAAQQISPVIANLDARIRDIVHSELAKFDSEIAALKAKVGGMS